MRLSLYFSQREALYFQSVVVVLVFNRDSYIRMTVSVTINTCFESILRKARAPKSIKTI